MESGTSPHEAEVDTLRRALAAVFSLYIAIALPSPVWAQGEPHKITVWPDNKKGALSLAFDDGCQSHAPVGLEKRR
jgi:hypothetical protein